MKQYSKLFSLIVLLGAANVMSRDNDNDNNNNHVLPFIQFRSQGRDTSRKLYGETPYAIYLGDREDGCYGTFDITVQYDQTFRNKEIAECLFGPAIVDGDCDRTIVISGLEAAAVPGAQTTRGPRELMAENFLLPRDFRSTISFSPKVQDVVVNFDFFMGLDRWCSGLYFRLYGPVVWNKTRLRAEENVINAGTATTNDDIGGGYTQGFFDPDFAVPTQALFNRALQFFGGCTFPRASYGDSDIAVQPLRFAKFSNCNLSTVNTNNRCHDDCDSDSHHKTGFAELRGEFGWNYIRENYRFLINLQAAAPTGSKVKSEFLFPAQVGNGHHWELGVGLGGAWRMWCNEDAERSLNFIVEADITHLFGAKQQLTFDLKCKPLSRYMLAERMVPTDSLPTEPDNAQLVNGTFQFDIFGTEDFQYAPVANFSTRKAKVTIGVQGDLVAMFNYTCRGFSWDLGYNFWAMSCSKIKLSCDDDCDKDDCNPIVQPFPVDTWALKGDASVVGFVSADADAVAVGLGATESKATIFTGTNTGATDPLSNPRIDNFTPALQAPAPGNELFVFETETAINTSNPPILISIDDLDIDGAEQRGLSHKIFTHFSYTWRDCCDRWAPYVGAGFSAEFGSHHGHDDCPTNTTTPVACDTCPSCQSCALSKWAVEIKGGVSFH